MDFVSRMLWFRSVDSNDYIGYTTGIENLEEWIISHNAIKEFEGFITLLDKIVKLSTEEGI